MTNPSLPASKGLASSQNWRDLGPNENQYPEDLPGITINSFDFKPTERLEFFNISDYTLDPKLFSKLLPYRFMVVEAKEGKDKQGKATVEYGIAGDGYFLIYTLPISPQGITIQTPFAIETTVLADGILTESNGAPLRNITIQGTTGILPFKNVNASSAGVGGLQTVGAIQNVGAQAQGIGKVFSGPVTGQDTLEPFMENNGYAQFKKLEKFLEYWAFLSKQPQGKNLRLAFDMPKDNNTFIVNPKTFTMTRDANSPLEYK